MMRNYGDALFSLGVRAVWTVEDREHYLFEWADDVYTTMKRPVSK